MNSSQENNADSIARRVDLPNDAAEVIEDKSPKSVVLITLVDNLYIVAAVIPGAADGSRIDENGKEEAKARNRLIALFEDKAYITDPVWDKGKELADKGSKVTFDLEEIPTTSADPQLNGKFALKIRKGDDE